MDPLVGQTIGGRYALHRLIGKGAMGRVYLAADQRLHGRECAIKILAAHADEDDEERSRFERELRIVSLLRGPNVVQVTDSGALDDGRPYIVMELLVGSSLHAMVRRRGPLPAREAVGIAIDVLSGLAEAHAYGVVHRDLKPANVFLCPTHDDVMQAKVLDFGVAKQLRGDDADITRTRASVGTPRYMAPEQFVQGALSARTDLYGVGTLLYVMLAGQPPFSGDEEVPEAVAPLPKASRLAWLHLYRAPPRVEGVSEALATLVARLLAKKPGDRPASARAVIEALRGVPEGAGIAAPALEEAGAAERRVDTRVGMPTAGTLDRVGAFEPWPSESDGSGGEAWGEAGTRREPVERPRRRWMGLAVALAVGVGAIVGLGERSGWWRGEARSGVGVGVDAGVDAAGLDAAVDFGAGDAAADLAVDAGVDAVVDAAVDLAVDAAKPARAPRPARRRGGRRGVTPKPPEPRPAAPPEPAKPEPVKPTPSDPLLPF